MFIPPRLPYESDAIAVQAEAFMAIECRLQQ